MKIVNEVFSISTKERSQMVDITSQIRSAVNKSGITNGDVIVYCPHTTAAVTINENADPSVVHEELIPNHHAGYRHSEGNSDAHCKSSIVGCSRQIIVREKSLNLGTWQGVFFCEFDGPRSRKVMVQVRGE
jgi:secondary thiamine-phosphate synthase enzyme